MNGKSSSQTITVYDSNVTEDSNETTISLGEPYSIDGDSGSDFNYIVKLSC